MYTQHVERQDAWIAVFGIREIVIGIEQRRQVPKHAVTEASNELDQRFRVLESIILEVKNRLEFLQHLFAAAQYFGFHALNIDLDKVHPRRIESVQGKARYRYYRYTWLRP